MIEKEPESNLYRVYLQDTETLNEYLGTEIEKSFGYKEVIIEGIDKIFDFSDIRNFDELRERYGNFKVLGYSINARRPNINGDPAYSNWREEYDRS